MIRRNAFDRFFAGNADEIWTSMPQRHRRFVNLRVELIRYYEPMVKGSSTGRRFLEIPESVIFAEDEQPEWSAASAQNDPNVRTFGIILTGGL